MKCCKCISVVLFVLVFFASCEKDRFEKPENYDKVLVLYLAGQNSLYSDMLKNVGELKKGFVPERDANTVVLIVSHGSYQYESESGQTTPYLIRMYKDKVGDVRLDTLHYYWKDELLTKPEVLSSTMDYIKKKFPSESYGFLMSSHATGWLPAGYYENPGAFSSQLKSIGQETGWENGRKVTVEMTPQEFAGAFPYHVDFILIDACLAGGVEIAYELKDVTDYIVFSPAEILSKGFPYDTLVDDVLNNQTEPGLKLLCQDFFDRFNSETGDDRSATITLVKSSGMENLASVCSTLFDKYRSSIDTLSYKNIQGYYRNVRTNPHWFFDLEDMLLKVGIDSGERADLSSAFGSAVIFKKATERFMPYSSGFTINHYCGMSTYLPNAGSAYLDNAYKNLAWNKATSFVR